MKKLMSVLLAAAICLSLAIPAMAAFVVDDTVDLGDEAMKNYVREQVSKVYDDFYTIPSMDVTILNKSVTSDKVTAEVQTEFTRILKADSAYDLPYIQGLQAGITELSDPNEIAAAQSNLDAWVEDLTGNYIGKEQTVTAFFKVEMPVKFSLSSELNSQSSIKFVDTISDELLDMDEFGLRTAAEMHEDGANATKQIAAMATRLSVQDYEKVDGPSVATDYDRIAARDYAREYALNYNPEYKDFDSSGGDCANFVSQCIHAGGIEYEPGVWAPYTTPWRYVSAGGKTFCINEYMVSRSYFFKCSDVTRAFAGSILWWTGKGHVGLIDHNDTVDITYCAHSKDEKSLPVQNIEQKTAFMPVWDSYAGQYTPQ